MGTGATLRQLWTSPPSLALPGSEAEQEALLKTDLKGTTKRRSSAMQGSVLPRIMGTGISA